MRPAISFLLAATSAFGVLFVASLALRAGFARSAAAPRGREGASPRPLVLDIARFAGTWTLVGYLPGAALVAATGDPSGAFLGVAAALATAAFARGLFGRGWKREAPPRHNVWAALESLLVLLGFLVFTAVQAATAGLAVA